MRCGIHTESINIQIGVNRPLPIEKIFLLASNIKSQLFYSALGYLDSVSSNL